jgi:hypothetical protein
MDARETAEAGVHRERVFELWDACASDEHGTEEALSNAKRIVRNARFVTLCKECAKHLRQAERPARRQGDALRSRAKRLD